MSRIRQGACGGGLLGREQAGSEPSIDRRLRDAELGRGLLDGEQVAGRGLVVAPRGSRV